MRFKLFLLFIGLPFICLAQTAQVDEIVNTIKVNLDFSLDETLIREQVRKYYRRPLNLNTASREELQNFPFLNSFQIQSILSYRALMGGFVEVNELKILPHFTQETEILLPLFSVTQTSINELESQQLRHFLVLGYGRQWDNSLYRNSALEDYAGYANEYFMRYNYQRTKGFSFGVTLQNDYYEPFFESYNQPNFSRGKTGFDYASFHVGYKSKGVLRQVIVGDYALYYGQGLMFWTGFSLNKSIYSTSIEKNNLETRPYTSAGEFNYLRGVMLDLKVSRNLSLHLFGSGKNMQSLRRNVNGENFYSVDQSGLNRELKDNKTFLKENLAGTRLKADFNKGHVGVTSFISDFSGKINPQNGIYDKFEFRDNKLSATSLDYSFQPETFLRLFGEGVYQNHGAYALLQGLTIAPNPFWEVAILYRNLSKNYYSHYANVFQEKSTPANEEGIYLGLRWQPSNWLSFSFYQDNYRSKWVSFRTMGPSSGNESFLRTAFYPNEHSIFSIQFRNETLFYNETENEIEQTQSGRRYQLRLQSDHEVSEQLQLRTRFDSKWLATNSYPAGFLLYQDFKWAPNFRFKLTVRIAQSFVEDSDVILYAQDSDVPYSYSITQFTKNATQLYFIIKWKLTRDLSFWLKTSNLTSNFNEDSNTLKTDKTFFKTRLQYDF